MNPPSPIRCRPTQHANGMSIPQSQIASLRKVLSAQGINHLPPRQFLPGNCTELTPFGASLSIEAEESLKGFSAPSEMSLSSNGAHEKHRIIHRRTPKPRDRDTHLGSRTRNCVRPAAENHALVGFLKHLPRNKKVTRICPARAKCSPTTRTRSRGCIDQNKN